VQIAGAIGVAGSGTAYLSLASSPGVGEATDAFAVVTGALALVALLATVMAAGSTRLPRDSS
jgi:hypothetical protein